MDAVRRAGAWHALVVVGRRLAVPPESQTRLRASVADAHGKLHELAESARERTNRDELTGAYNRRQLMEALDREASRASRTGNLLCIARIDLDRMRNVNESFGQAVGDDVL